MALTNHKIEGSTPVKNFPQEYNSLIDELVSEINRLEGIITRQNNTIAALQSELAAEEREIKSTLGTWFDQKMDEFENKFVKKTDN